ncbi:hypothetical protein EHZ19_28750 [Paraburkholderia bannensis]|nr:hypothetical protein [Paraburkholderia bannensis]RQM44438.1 hypothetical protein EHZ19_28750 [Paraburkholderia bannensis]
MKGYEAFGVDHYRPKEDFPALIVSYPNLFYCCNTCNSHKSRYWPESALQLMRFIPNPCDHIMFEHMKFVGYEVVPRTSAGRWTVDLLDLNDPEVVAFREFIVETIERYVEDESRLQRLEEAVHVAERSGALSATDAQAKLLIIGKKMFNVRKHLARLRGS